MTANTELVAAAPTSAGVGHWRWDRRTGKVAWDRQLEGLFGLPPGGFAGTFEAWLALVHPDDRQPSTATLEKAIEECSPLLFEHRCVGPDGSVHWLECRAELVVKEGEVVGATGVGFDIDHRRQLEEQ